MPGFFEAPEQNRPSPTAAAKNKKTGHEKMHFALSKKLSLKFKILSD